MAVPGLCRIGIATMFLAAGSTLAGSAGVPKPTDVVVTLGDSITDGCTYPQIVMQALKEAGRPAPTIVCAGVASDTAAQMAARLDKTVLARKPNIVTFLAGSNDSLRNVTAEQYEKSLREISAKVKAAGATLVLLTPCVICPGQGGDEKAREAARKRAEAAEAVVAQYVEVIRKVAKEEGYAVAENNARMRKARDEGKEVMAADGVHPNYLGQSVIARSILDAFGHEDVPLPAEFKPRLFPGIIGEWKMRLAPLDDRKKPIRLSEGAAREIRPDATWKTYALPDPVPEAKPGADDWWEQERRNGFGLQVEKTVGKGLVQACATIEAAESKKAYVNTGIGISTVWLNGMKIHDQGPGWTGFHAGKERIPVELRKGANAIVAEIDGPQFFLSVTDKLLWEEDMK